LSDFQDIPVDEGNIFPDYPKGRYPSQMKSSACSTSINSSSLNCSDRKSRKTSKFSGAANSHKVFYELTEKQELNKFITKLRVRNQNQLKLLKIKAECIKEMSRNIDRSASIKPTETGSTSRTRRNFTR
jgi:hypothetical protein